ncbi:PTS glucose transporter subunit IIA [Mycoplasmopsis edwardii]|uniref:PTS glucose transporter subunit IIA n=1 Tax=Mycoplasmopsis edwardii TaxID=53558 RepID=A0ACD4PHS7_9BACT|nr:PTS glucose transporter subunit IIA [Mycoplasmopsis edwardii]WBP84147.1 PTS glucose transporter subunit IIA [Mycoplasmopsis edwardii]
MEKLNNSCSCKPFFGCVCGQEVPQNIMNIVEAFGGINNINGFNASVSELRYDLKNVKLVNEEQFKKLGAKKVVIFEGTKHVQVELGEGVEELNFNVKKYSPLLKAMSNQVKSAIEQNKNTNNQVVSEVSEQVVLSPVNGKIVALKDLKDGIFSEGLVGNGVAILISDDSKVVAPFDGKITMMPANKNQFIFSSKEGVELVVVLGQDSYKLDGIGLEPKVKLNEEVKAGTLLFELNLKKFDSENIDKHIVVSTTKFSSLNNIEEVASKAEKSKQLFKLV